MDVVTPGREKFFWHRNNLNNEYDSIVIEAKAVGRVHAADIDGDGDNDLFADGSAYINDGTGQFTKYEMGWGKSLMHAVDLDADGDMDIISADADKGLLLHKNNGAEPFTNHDIDRSENKVQSIQTADMDGDGDIDITIGSLGSGVTVFKNDGALDFTPNIIYDEGEVSAIQVVDLNGNRPDILAAVKDKGQVLWFENRNGGIQKQDLNPAPTDILLAANPIEENEPAGTIVGNLTLVDQESAGGQVTDEERVGEKLWEFQTGGEVNSSPAIGEMERCTSVLGIESSMP